METFNIFIVEDDPFYGKILEHHLSLNKEYKVSRYTTGAECLHNLHLKPDLITIDLTLADMTGDILFKKIRTSHPEIPIIFISSQQNINIAIKLLKMGGSDYIVKDDTTKDLLWNSIIRIRENKSLKIEIDHLKEELGQKYNFERSIIGQSEPLKKIFTLIEKASKSVINVSINGETGTGKEVVAKAIHYNSERKKKKFVALNMAAIPKELMESELFGYEKGAFTGAIARKIGKFEEAEGGTIFLDEIAEMNLNLQTKLLRVLQEREVTRIGGEELIKLDIRLLVASNKNIAEEVKKGNFREDLYFRIIGLPITLPPLRDRGNDILILAKHFLDEFIKENKMTPKILSNDAKEKLLRYFYPGNVRELKSMIELAAVLCEGKEILPEDISYLSIKADKTFLDQERTLKGYNSDIVKFFLKKYNDDYKIVAQKLDIGKSTIYKMAQRGELE